MEEKKKAQEEAKKKKDEEKQKKDEEKAEAQRKKDEEKRKRDEEKAKKDEEKAKKARVRGFRPSSDRNPSCRLLTIGKLRPDTNPTQCIFRKAKGRVKSTTFI